MLPFLQLLRIKPSSMAAILPVSDFSNDEDVVMLTSNGQIKRTSLSQFAKINARGTTAMRLKVVAQYLFAHSFDSTTKGNFLFCAG